MSKDPQEVLPKGYVVALLTLIVTAIGVAVALVPFNFGMLNDDGESAAGRTSRAPTAAADSSVQSGEVTNSASQNATGPQASKVGDCLTADSTSVPCDVEHRQQIFALAGDCSSMTLVRFLGGVPRTDVLREDLVLRQREGNSCSVLLPESLKATTTLQDILLTSESARFRRCYDAMADRDVDCGEVHTAEYVFEELGRTTNTTDCTQHATAYMGTEIKPLFRTLEVQGLASEERALCRISVKGTNTLVGSLRNLGSKPVPLAGRQ